MTTRIRDDVLECQGHSRPEFPEEETGEAWDWYTLELYEDERE